MKRGFPHILFAVRLRQQVAPLVSFSRGERDGAFVFASGFALFSR